MISLNKETLSVAANRNFAGYDSCAEIGVITPRLLSILTITIRRTAFCVLEKEERRKLFKIDCIYVGEDVLDKSDKENYIRFPDLARTIRDCQLCGVKLVGDSRLNVGGEFDVFMKKELGAKTAPEKESFVMAVCNEGYEYAEKTKRISKDEIEWFTILGTC